MPKKEIDKLKEIKTRIKLGGGDKAILKQHEKGKYTARERINLLFDKDSFVETGLFVKHRSQNFDMPSKDLPGDGVVTGYGLVNGRLVYASSQDFTVSGGSLGEMHANKIAHAQESALKAGVPFIAINDSGGARIQEGVDSLAGFGKIFYNNTLASGIIPQISAIMGPCAGGAVYSPALTDFIFMVDKTSQMFITGPAVIKSVTGEEIDADNLGGTITHNEKSGVAHFYSSSEEECIEKIKQLLSYLPQNNLDVNQNEKDIDLNRVSDNLNEIIPSNSNQAYDMLDVIKELVDDDIMQYQELFAKNIITCFARIAGKTVGIIASQPKVKAGCLDIDASDKAARFIRTCDSFNIPLLTLVDVPGFLPGVNQEYGGIIRHGAKMLYAYSEATVPMITIITRKAFGGAYIAMSSKHLGSDFVYAWPSAQISVMGAEGAANIIFSKEIKASNDPVNTKKEKIKEYDDLMMNPYVAASRGFVDDVIEPSQTRKYIISALQVLEGKKTYRPKRKHGNMPL